MLVLATWWSVLSTESFHLSPQKVSEFMPKSTWSVVAQLCQFASLLIDAFWVWLAFRMHPVYKRYMFWNKFPCLKKKKLHLHYTVLYGLLLSKIRGWGCLFWSIYLQELESLWAVWSPTVVAGNSSKYQMLWAAVPLRLAKCSALLTPVGIPCDIFVSRACYYTTIFLWVLFAVHCILLS